ncbi:MAG TPA: hypothetical protein VFY24_08275 [Azospira sp.]|nr:hypothetical protein [Azospira sp.]
MPPLPRQRSAITSAIACLGLVALVLAGCASPQPLEKRFFEQRGRPVAEAARYAGDDTNRVHRLWIDLRTAPRFRIRLPDGHWANSDALDAPLLLRHGLSISELGGRRVAIWHPPFAPGAIVGRHLYIDLELGPDERATALTLGACGWSLASVLGSADGQRSFGFPLAVTELDALLGAPARIERVELLTGHSCF